ncbi:response regulator [Tunicatimonas pelagia]|uniref:response regulator n=1 Tax=Tunicatimonas pelagia TaxID=931531 RepID=UPI00266718A0|nr:response regulator [Tunicatimonas pelagia]WKN44370.1 response regulator [Tunicatimonas pelagia]
MNEKRILILDDEEEICFLLATLLSQMGYQTDYVHTIDDGVRKIYSEQPFDLVFLDLNLPDGLGHHIIPLIKDQHQQAKIVMISAHGSILEQIRNQSRQFDHFITKPFNRENISQILSELNL